MRLFFTMLRIAVIVLALKLSVFPAEAGTPVSSAIATPTPSVSAIPLPSASAIPLPSASVMPVAGASPTLKEIGHVVRATRQIQPPNLIGTADSASQGLVTATQITTRPVVRTGDILETIPGVVISQHSGEGKANQYYLRGFNLDHGTDLAGFIAGMPINLPTHAHGQGYSDINWVIPELIGDIRYDKGPYDTTVGDFSTAGSYRMSYRDTIPTTVSVGGGSFGYDRGLFAGTSAVGRGNLLYAAEYYHDDGSFVKPDNYQKYNGVLRYSFDDAKSAFNATAGAYSGVFGSSDQIPQRLVAAGILSPYGNFDPSDGGTTHRYALSTEYRHEDPNGTTRFTAYGFHYDLDLFSNLTYDAGDATDYYDVTANPLTCNPQFTTCTPGATHANNFASYCPSDTLPPGSTILANGQITPGTSTLSCGDQREQLDNRFVTGGTVSRTFTTPGSVTTVGADIRSDNIGTSGLYLTNDRARYVDGTLSDDHVLERDVSAYATSDMHIGTRLRVKPGVRLDTEYLNVAANLAPNSGHAFAALVDPKLTVAYRASKSSEFYGDFGESFHSNDARGVVQTVDPQTHTTYTDAGAPVGGVTPLVRAIGSEVGYRYGTTRETATISLWQLNLASELVFDGDTAQTDAGPPSHRRGVELSDRFQVTRCLNLDGDFDLSSAHFTQDPQNLGTDIPEAIRSVGSLGATLQKPGYDATLRMRYFGPRYLSQDGTAVSPESTLFNAQITAKTDPRTRLVFDVLNMLNAPTDDVEYYYPSWTPTDAHNPAYANNPAINPALGGGGVNDHLIHRTQKRSIRLTWTHQI